MKSPKEEAEELVNNFYDLGLFAVAPIEAQAIAVKCAIICVDRIIKEINDVIPFAHTYDVEQWQNEVKHWQQVKSELEKMKNA